MNRLKYKIVYLSILTFTLGVICMSCSRQPDPDDAAIKINNYVLTAREYEDMFREMGGDSTGSPMMRREFTDNLVTRKLLLQEAERIGLDRRDDFLKSIENFWEQSLLKIIIDEKTKEILSGIEVKEEDIRSKYLQWKRENPDSEKGYEEMREVLKWHIIKEREAVAFNSWIEELKKNANIVIDKKAVGIE
ncbi:MAG: hypothetical protein JW800_05050 [Candidatus Omnitrophica bacterium]|nr:hypothetical protein [Candidatus Omnitrophota bacterium]